MADKQTTPEQPQVAAPKNALIGDDAIEVREPTVEVVKEQRPAQVKGPDAEVVDKVNVHEVVVAMDTVVTDPSSPEAVQIPDAGRGSLDLPIHALDGPRVEDVFAKEASEADEPADEA